MNRIDWNADIVDMHGNPARYKGDISTTSKYKYIVITPGHFPAKDEHVRVVDQFGCSGSVSIVQNKTKYVSAEVCLFMDVDGRIAVRTSDAPVSDLKVYGGFRCVSRKTVTFTVGENVTDEEE